MGIKLMTNIILTMIYLNIKLNKNTNLIKINDILNFIVNEISFVTSFIIWSVINFGV